MHLDEELLQRLVDGELAETADAPARRHLAECAACRRRVAEAEHEARDVESLLRSADGPAPAIAATHVIARARASRASATQLAMGRWAAGILLALGLGAAAYAMPGSPLPAWTKAVLSLVGGTTSRPGEPLSPEPGGPTPPPAESGDLAGIAVLPGRDLLIEFAARQANGQLRVRLTDGAEVVVRAPAGAATFGTDASRLVIHNVSPSASYDIGIPHVSPRVEIRVGGARVFLKEGARVTSEGRLEASETYVVPLGR